MIDVIVLVMLILNTLPLLKSIVNAPPVVGMVTYGSVYLLMLLPTISPLVNVLSVMSLASISPLVNVLSVIALASISPLVNVLSVIALASIVPLEKALSPITPLDIANGIAVEPAKT